MTLTRRSFLSITAVAAALTAAVVYGSDSGGASSASGNNLIIWADQKKADSLTEFAKKWGEQQGITVTVQTVANELQSNFITANQAGNGPDVVLGAHDWIGNLVQNGSILPIALSAEARANYTDIALRAVTYEGQTYAAPYAVECVSLFVNKDLTQVTAPTTIEELIAAGKAAGTEVILSLPVGEKGDAYNMEPIYTAAGGYLFGKDANGDYLAGDLGVGGEGSIAAAKKIGALGADGVLRNSITGDNAISLFTGGKAPYLVSGPWALGDIKKAGINYTITKIPGFGDIEGSAATPFAETLVADVAKDSSFAEAMFPLNELPPAQKDLVDKLKSSNPDMATISEFAAAADPMPAIPAMSAVWQPLGLAQANIVKGADPEQTMRSAGEEIKRNIG